MPIDFTDLSKDGKQRAIELTKRLGKGAPIELDIMTLSYLLGFLEGLSMRCSLTITYDGDSVTIVVASEHGEATFTGADLAGALLALDLHNEARARGEPV